MEAHKKMIFNLGGISVIYKADKTVIPNILSG